MPNVLEKSASAFPDVSVTPPVATTESVLERQRGGQEDRCVVSRTRDTELISVAPEKSANVLLLTVNGRNGSEKVSVTQLRANARGVVARHHDNGRGSVSAIAAVASDERGLQRVSARSVVVPSSSSRKGSAPRLGTEPAV